MTNNPTVVALEGVQKLLAQENGMWRTLSMIDNYCENEIARAEETEKQKLEVPQWHVRKAVPRPVVDDVEVEVEVDKEVKECAN